MCLISAIVGTVIQFNKKLDYLDLDIGTNVEWNTSSILMILKNTGTWVLIFT